MAVNDGAMTGMMASADKVLVAICGVVLIRNQGDGRVGILCGIA